MGVKAGSPLVVLDNDLSGRARGNQPIQGRRLSSPRKLASFICRILHSVNSHLTGSLCKSFLYGMVVSMRPLFRELSPLPWDT